MLSFQQIKSNTHVVILAGVHYLSKPVVIRGKNIRITGEDGAVIRGTSFICLAMPAPIVV